MKENLMWKIIFQIYLSITDLQLEREKIDHTDDCLENWLCQYGFEVDEIQEINRIGRIALEQGRVKIKDKEFWTFMELADKFCEIRQMDITLKYSPGCENLD